MYTHTHIIVPAVDSDGTVARLPLDSQQVSNEINERHGLLGAFAGRPLEVVELSNGTALLRLEMKTGKGEKKNSKVSTVLCAHSLETCSDFYNSHHTIDFSCQVAQGFRSSWLQITDRFPYIRYTNCKYYLLYSTT